MERINKGFTNTRKNFNTTHTLNGAIAFADLTDGTCAATDEGDKVISVRFSDFGGNNEDFDSTIIAFPSSRSLLELAECLGLVIDRIYTLYEEDDKFDEL
jgi:hypothetical protein